MKKIRIRCWHKKPTPPTSDYDEIKYVSSFTEIPEDLEKKIFIVKTKGKNKWVVFKCPDNCGNRVEVNLMKSKHPFWRLNVKKNKVTLYPSVIVKDCHSHFCLINSKIEWINDMKFDSL